MALNFGQDEMLLNMDNSDSLKERWQQSSSEVKTVGVSGVQDEVLITVTAGKKFYLTSISYACASNSPQTLELLNGSGGAVKGLFRAATNNVTYTQTFASPIKFTTNVYASSAEDFFVTLTGWEENE